MQTNLERSSTVNERVTVTRVYENGPWLYQVEGKIFETSSSPNGFSLSEDELRHLWDKANEFLGDSSDFQAGYDLAVANGALIADDAVTVNKTILESLLDAKSITTMEQAVFAYLRERGVVFT